MKKNYNLILLLLLSIAAFTACKRTKVTPVDINLFSGVYKAREVKEADVTVYRLGSTNNIIPGYSRYRIAFIAAAGTNKVRITEYNGEVFEGIWDYNESNRLLTFSNLAPRPQAQNFVFQVDSAESGLLVLSNTDANPKTGETVNQYTLIPE